MVDIESSIRGHHVYRSVWTLVIDEVLVCEWERHNIHDPFAVVVYKGFTVVCSCSVQRILIPQSNLLKSRKNFPKLWAHSGNSEKFASWKNNPLYGTWLYLAVQQAQTVWDLWSASTLRSLTYKDLTYSVITLTMVFDFLVYGWS